MRLPSKLLLFFFSVSLLSCAPNLYHIKGSYLNKPYQIYSDKSKDEVWNKIIELFSSQGIAIKLIDKNSGLILSERTSFLSDYSYENDDGSLQNPNAFVVCDKVVWQTVLQYPKQVTGEWNIRVVENSGKTLINVNLVNIQVIFSTNPALEGTGKSTGKYERIVADYLK